MSDPIAPPAKALLIFFDATDQWGDESLLEAIVRELAKHHIAGATAIHGIMGHAAPQLCDPSLERGVDTRVIQALLGHSRIDTTDGQWAYEHRCPSTLLMDTSSCSGPTNIGVRPPS